jgi:hypothetical protein
MLQLPIIQSSKAPNTKIPASKQRRETMERGKSVTSERERERERRPSEIERRWGAKMSSKLQMNQIETERRREEKKEAGKKMKERERWRERKTQVKKQRPFSPL